MVKKALFIFLGTVFYLSFSGCSLMGLGIGAAIHKGESREISPLSREVQEIVPGNKLQVTLRNDSIVVGKVKTLQTVPLEQYRSRYTQFLAHYSSAPGLPAFNDSLTLIYRGRQTIRVSFQGWDLKGVWVFDPAFGRTLRFPYQALYGFRWKPGQEIPVDSLRMLLYERAVPLRSRLILQTPTGEKRTLLWTDIRKITLLKRKNYAFPGFLIGAVIDFWVIINLSHMEMMGDFDLGTF